MATPTIANPSAFTGATSCCPSCGVVTTPQQRSNSQDDLLQAQARIAELETQVTQLNEKAAAAVSRWAEYEAELHKLRSAQRPSTPQQTQQPDPPVQQSPPSILQQGTSRLSSLLYPRKSTPNLRVDVHRQNSLPLPNQQPLSAGPGATSAEDLMEALTREQTLRKEAEGRLSATSKEVEELSASLFEQANEMVADERRARAKLEERVGELEKRDKEKRRRLERLEGAMGRIEKVRNMLEQS
ncbi:hypothetical protein QQS21_006554 [Conoideocrella luteorostrata]|uniref:GDP/GTP exchange factor Sec2 N-terminal domain-containing protein n=1 Tax=Conoideocrella luteorostrata TaxID=1105319 RepID=A0AAJ0CRN0_9HYPO|nr:hypothetical protein QQS21_006554 [Conoideocrella luteorostrata]